MSFHTAWTRCGHLLTDLNKGDAGVQSLTTDARRYSWVRPVCSHSARRTGQGFTTVNSSAGLAKWPRTAGLPMFEVTAVEIRCTPTVEKVTAKTPLPTMRPKLTRKVLGENLAPGSVEFKVTV